MRAIANHFMKFDGLSFYNLIEITNYERGLIMLALLKNNKPDVKKVNGKVYSELFGELSIETMLNNEFLSQTMLSQFLFTEKEIASLNVDIDKYKIVEI